MYQLLKDKSDAIDVYWFVTSSGDYPRISHIEMLKDYVDQTGELPKWNK